jgi:N-acetylglucosaminyldiphosphoundecaprenol N-acetyl-beta-D-mannosaminyltransferase
MTTRPAQQLSLGGIRLDALEQSDLIRLMQEAPRGDGKLLILHHNLHSLYLYETHEGFRESYRTASCVYIDGLPVVWIARALGLPVNATHRITFLDSFGLILDHAAQCGWRIYYLGSSPEVNRASLPLLRAAHPGLVMSGHHGFLTTRLQSEAVIEQINAFKPDVLFVGMGMPLQELWLSEHWVKINARAILTSGATLDYVTGHAYRPPRWAGRLGLYGVFRMFSDPRRLWRRYLVEPIFLLMFLFRRLAWSRRSRSEGWTAESG